MTTALTLAAVVALRLWLGIAYTRYMRTQPAAVQAKMAELRAYPTF